MNVDDLKIIRVRIPDGRPDEVRKMCSYARTLKERLFKDGFVRLLQAWNLSDEDIENLLSVMQRYPMYAINEQQMKWLNEYQDSLYCETDASASANETKTKEEAISQAKEAFCLKYDSYFDNIETFLDSLKTMRGKELKALFGRVFAKSDVTLKAFFEDCKSVVPERNTERGWNYEAIKKH